MTSQNEFRVGSIKPSPNTGLIKDSQDISLSKQQVPATYYVPFAQDQNSTNTWTLSFSNKLLMNQVATALGHLASISSENHFSTHIGSQPSSILESEISETLYSSLRTALYLTNMLTQLLEQTQTKSSGHIERKLNSQKKQRKS